jgi:pSer/pThr/pTyr-binding forkhead associated (FHA) protein
MVEPGAPRAITAAELKARIDAERAGVPFLLYRDSGEELRIFPLVADTRVTVGRDAANDVALAWDTEASRLHAELERLGGEWTVADDGLSRNGTYVNGTRIAGRRRLRDGDVLNFGATQALYRAPAVTLLDETRARSTMAAVPSLSPAQRRVLVALCRPFAGPTEHAMPATNQEIADELVVTVDAVKAQLRALFDKFDVGELPQNRKRARLVELAFQSGLVRPRDLG